MKCQAQLELTLMMCLGDRSTFTSTGVLSDHFTFTLTSAFNGRHDRSSPLFFLEDLLSSRGVCVCKSLSFLPPQSFQRLWKALLVPLFGIIEEEDSSVASLFFQKEEVQLWCKVQSWGSSFVS